MRRHAKAFVAISVLLLLTCALGAMSATAAAPTVTIEAPTGVSYTSAHVSGKVNPEDTDTYYSFETSTDGVSWSGFSFQGPLFAGLGSTDVASELTGLSPGTQYFVRLVANNFVDPEVISTEETFTTDPVASPTVTLSAPSAVTDSSAHFSGEIDPNAPEAAPATAAVEAGFKVDWHFECTPACPGLSGGTVAADNTGHEVTADATGLQPNTSYEIALGATNAGGPVSAGPLTLTTAELEPNVYSAPVANVTRTGAILTGIVNPHNSAVGDCHFEYGPTAAYGQTIPCEQSPSGNQNAFVTGELTGLAAETTLHFRLVVTTTGGTVEGEDRTFTTLPPLAPEGNCANAAIRAQQEAQMLPECRAFEQVSPVDKNGANVSLGKLTQSAEAPGGIAYTSSTAFPGGDAALAIGYYRSARGPGGWTTRPVDLPQQSQVTSTVETTRRISAELDRSASASNLALTPDADPNGFNVYVNDLDGGPIALMAKEGSPTGSLASAFTNTDQGPVFGATRDFGRLVFDSRADLGQGATTGVMNVWEWHEGQLSLVSRLPDGSPSPSGGYTGNMQQFPTRGQQFISEDGSRIYFGIPIYGPGTVTLGIYVREDGATTKLVSRSYRPGDDPTLPHEAKFNGMSADGRYAFISSGDRLTSDAPPGDRRKLYRYDLAQDSLELIAENLNEGSGGAGGEIDQIATLQASSDGQRIYFTSLGKVTPDTPPQRGQIYLWDHGDLRRVAQGYLGARGYLDFAMSADGRYAAFGSIESPTGFNSTSSACPEPGGEPGPCTEIYLYDAVSEAVSCLSCAPGGTSAGSATLDSGGSVDISVGYIRYVPRSVRADGTVNFDTPTALVPEDTNRKRDVYTARDGQVRLLSSGVDRNNALYLDTNVDGTDVYFATTGRLVAQDDDNLRDVYTARVDGGIPAQNVPAPREPGCEGESCQGLPPRQATTPAIGSEGIRGDGNAKPPVRSALAFKGRIGATGSSTSLSVRVRTAGTLRASGTSIRSVQRSIAKPKTVSVPISLTAEGRRELSARGAVSVRVNLTLQMKSGGKVVKEARVTFKQPGNSGKGGS